MLILVGVTINFAINGGIINKAKTASSDMQKAADKEQLQLAIIASKDYITEEIVESDLKKNLSGWTVTKNQDGSFSCTSPSKNNFSVSKTGVIENGNSQGEEDTEEEEEEVNYKFYTVDALEYLTKMDVKVDEGAYENAYVGYVITDNEILFPGFIYFDNEPTQIDGAIFLLNALAFDKGKFVNNFTVEINGIETTYERAFLRRTAYTQEYNYQIAGYIENNEFHIVTSEYDSNIYSSQQGVDITEYTQIESAITLTEAKFKTAESLNYSIYKKNIENESKVVQKELIALNPTNTKVHKGTIFVDEEYAETQHVPYNLEIFEENYECVLLPTYVAQMSEGDSITLNNVIMTTQHMDEMSLREGGEPIGYIDGNRFVELESQYDNSNRDANGYPAVYTSLQETGNVYVMD